MGNVLTYREDGLAGVAKPLRTFVRVGGFRIRNYYVANYKK